MKWDSKAAGLGSLWMPSRRILRHGRDMDVCEMQEASELTVMRISGWQIAGPMIPRRHQCLG